MYFCASLLKAKGRCLQIHRPVRCARVCSQGLSSSCQRTRGRKIPLTVLVEIRNPGLPKEAMRKGYCNKCCFRHHSQHLLPSRPLFFTDTVSDYSDIKMGYSEQKISNSVELNSCGVKN